MTLESIIDICARSAAEDWVYWTYLPHLRAISESPTAAARGRAGDHYARALYMKDVSVGVAWGRTADVADIEPPSWACTFPDPRCSQHWVDLLYDHVALVRYLAVAVDGGRASLPAPRVEHPECGDGQAFWVPRDKYVVVRLANELDPCCSDFDVYFEQSGIEVR